jgi:hypothetical protein
MFQADYTRANECLSYAFEHCHREAQHNKRLILVYLTPVKVTSCAIAWFIPCDDRCRCRVCVCRHRVDHDFASVFWV